MLWGDIFSPFTYSVFFPLLVNGVGVSLFHIIKSATINKKINSIKLLEIINVNIKSCMCICAGCAIVWHARIKQ
jgi:hypothetical protein